ncbi:hypothetical protein [Bailinhaonella thermotolerans]|uniref:Uncharacterized protein n=1 Tax=Bailinhaonella thermotolerans TaxID=1070861 RepID=A0A3A4A2I5_9ACTN|nr:hypothetical protein [Bailinhaonella thermotolerans]RJL22530.1 hypothetical protein D5H75_35530 [Bailinhaonella thermotolerans]
MDFALAPGAPAKPVPGTPIPEVAGPREETLAGAARLAGARRGIKVVPTDGAGLPGAEFAAAGGLLPGPHALLPGPAFEDWLDARS